MDHQRTAASVLTAVGGAGNVESLVHCATRLRFTLSAREAVDDDAVRSIDGVLTTTDAGGQYQVVIGNEVPEVFAHLRDVVRSPGEDAPKTTPGPRKSPLNRFISMIAEIFTPLLWALAATGLLKALLAVSVTAGWMDEATSTYAILNALSDAFILFLPLALAITAATYFKAQQFTSFAMAGALVYPGIADLAGQDGVEFFGVPVVMVSYASTVIPAIVMVWAQSHLERVLYQALPAALRRFLVPMIVIALLVPLTFILVGPVSNVLSTGLSTGVGAVFETAPWLGGALVGGLWQVLVIFGLHWTFIPLFVVEYQSGGFIFLLAPVFAAKLAQTAATAAVWIRTKDSRLRSLSAPATLSGLLAGVTEPALYGVNLPLKRPFAFGIVGGVLGGALIAAGGIASNSFALASLIAVPSLLGRGTIAFVFIGIGTAMAVSFLLTLLFGVPRAGKTEPAAASDAGTARDASAGAGSTSDHADEAGSTPAPADGAGPIDAPSDGRHTLLSPLDGEALPLAEVDDAAFGGGALGPGLAIRPSGRTLHAPFDATVVAVLPTRHAVGLRGPGGVEVLMHIGVETTRLGGRHFTARVGNGDAVTAGQVLIEFDAEAIRAEGYDPITPVVITNGKRFGLADGARRGPVRQGERLFTAVPLDREPTGPAA